MLIFTTKVIYCRSVLEIVKIYMTIEEFLNTPIADLAKRSGIAKENLSRYFRGKALTENTLNRLSLALDMPSYRVLEAIIIRRKNSCINLQPCANLKEL